MKKVMLILILMIGSPVGTNAQNDKSHIPNDLEEAVKSLDKLISDEDKSELRKMNEDEYLAATHFGIGRYIRNEWGLWRDSNLSKYFRHRGIKHPDDMSGEILRAYYKFICQSTWNDIDLLIGTYRGVFKGAKMRPHFWLVEGPYRAYRGDIGRETPKKVDLSKEIPNYKKLMKQAKKTK